MKHISLTLLALAIAISSQATQPMVKPAPKSGCSIYGVVNKQQAGKISLQTPAKVSSRAMTLDDLLADPEGTVFSGPYIAEEAAFSGFQNSDQGRPENPSKYYQYYNGCPYSISAVRVIGLFNYWDEEDYDWYMCDERAGYDEKYTMTKPVTFEVSFYRVGDDGLPGECVYTKNISLKGRYVGAVYGMEGNQGPLMEFIADLGEEVKLETGFMSFSAAKIEGETPTCWFSLFTATSSYGYGMVDMEPYGFIGANPCVFSLIGSGDLAAAKALKLSDLKSPTLISNGSHETVRVSLQNVGKETISDTELQLYVDDKLIVTEKPGINLPSLAERTYTFAQRADLSEPGEHKVVVKNVTPGDENISISSVAVDTKTYAKGETYPSGGQYSYPEDAIVNVTVGDINNNSEANEEGYEDFTDKSTDITAGQTLQLTAQLNPEGDGGVIGAWADWNSDGLFSGEGEFLGYLIEEYIPVAIPGNISVTPGPKVLRIVGNTGGEIPSPHGEYYFGQTEDYTLNVVRPANSPAATANVEFLESESDETVSLLDFAVSNEGTATLEGTITVDYELPSIYENRQTVAQAPANIRLNLAKARKAADPRSEDVAYVLHYDGGKNSAVGVGNYADAIFGQAYPVEMLSSIRGMKISSIDVYIQEVPVKTFAQIYENVDGTYKLVSEQEFTPVEDSWNHVELQTPYTISGKDLIYAVKLTGMTEGHFYIGIDGISAVRGFGDLCNVGGSTWWSMADLGIDNNFCVRANVTGERTADISWLSVDKNQISVEPGKSEDLKATINRDNLIGDSYEARIVIATNDPLSPALSIPVYMTKTLEGGLDISTLTNCDVRISGNKLVVISDKKITAVTINNVAGSTTGYSNKAGNSVTVSLDNCASGIYIVSVRYADGSNDTMKMAIKR